MSHYPNAWRHRTFTWRHGQRARRDRYSLDLDGVPFVGYFGALYIEEYRIIIRQGELVSTGGLLVLPVEPRPRCQTMLHPRFDAHLNAISIAHFGNQDL